MLTFAKDTVKMDTVFSNVGSSTYTFWVFNNSGDGIRLSAVRLKKGNQTGFRVNVDGSYLDNTTGSVVTDLEVRKGDSIRVFVELTAPENRQQEAQLVEDDLVFQLESGVEQRVNLRSFAWDAVKVSELRIKKDTLLELSKPLVVYKGIKVDSGAVLTIKGSTLYFHDKAGIVVRGTLKTENVVMRGDRLDHMFDYLTYDRVSGQWAGISFDIPSKGNVLTDTEIRNAMTAIHITDTTTADTLTQRLTMTRCIIHNAKGYGVEAYSSNVGLYYCQLSNTLDDCVALFGGKVDIDYCTLAQFYPLTANRGAALRFSSMDNLRLNCTNTIVTGYDADVVMAVRPDTTNLLRYRFDNCLLRTPAVKDDTVSFKNIHWETPQDTIQGSQHFIKVDDRNMIYDFHLDSLSTAKGKGCYPFRTQ